MPQGLIYTGNFYMLLPESVQAVYMSAQARNDVIFNINQLRIDDIEACCNQIERIL